MRLSRSHRHLPSPSIMPVTSSSPRALRSLSSHIPRCRSVIVAIFLLSLLVLSSVASPAHPNSPPRPDQTSHRSSHSSDDPPHQVSSASFSAPSSSTPPGEAQPLPSVVASAQPGSPSDGAHAHTPATAVSTPAATAATEPAVDLQQQVEIQAEVAQDSLSRVDISALQAAVDDARQAMRQGLLDERASLAHQHSTGGAGSQRRLFIEQQAEQQPVSAERTIESSEVQSANSFEREDEQTETPIVESDANSVDTASGDNDEQASAKHETQLMVDDLIAQADRLLASPVATTPEVNEALSLLSHAATLGSSHAHVELAKAYLYGDLAPRNLSTAFAHFQQAADAGNSTAQHYLAFLYSLRLAPVPAGASATGLAVLYDYFAAVAGEVGAKMSMGYRHVHGYGVPKSCESAVQYYDAVARHVVNALSHSAHNHVMTIDRAHLSDEQARMAHMEESAEVLQYYQHSADGGNVDAQLTMGQLHYYGHRGLPQNPALAARYFRLAAAAGNTNAMASLGQMHLSGMMDDLHQGGAGGSGGGGAGGGGGGGGGLFGGVGRRDGSVPYEHGDSNSSALNLFTRAAELGNPAAQTSLGLLHLQGTLGPANYTLAASYFLTAAQQGHPEAQFQLGVMHLGGIAFTQDVLKAYMYFQAAASFGHVRGLFNVAQMDIAGLGVPRDCKGGADKLKMVAERGEWSRVLAESHERFLAGEYESGWLGYALAGYEGQEVGQANAAWLMDRQYVQLWRDEAERYSIAYGLLQQSAEQRNVESYRLMGDYAFYQLVPSNASHSLAAQHYQKATNEAGYEHSAQAAFNLAWMYHHGLGVERDLHLAKRYYDHSADMDDRGWVACKLALARLWLDGQVEEWTHWWDGSGNSTAAHNTDGAGAAGKAGQSSGKAGAGGSRAGSTSNPYHAKRAVDGVLTRGLRAVFGDESASWGWYDYYVALENCVLVCASLALGACIYYRAQRM